MNPEHLELLVTRVMPYGKYKGRLIADLPGHYLNWFASQGFPPGEIGQLLDGLRLLGTALGLAFAAPATGEQQHYQEDNQPDGN